MEKLITILKRQDGTKIKIETYISCSVYNNYKISWFHRVSKCLPKKRKFNQAVPPDYSEIELLEERIKFTDLLKQSL